MDTEKTAVPALWGEMIRSIASEENFMRMYEVYYEKVYNYLFFRLFSKEAAEDLSSEIFLKVFDKRMDYDPGTSKFSTWIFAIAKNCLTDHFKKNRRYERLVLTEFEALVSHEPDICETVSDSIEQEYALKALGKLEERDRAVVYLKYFEGFTYGEIALNMGISEKNAGVILTRAMKKLKKLLGNYTENIDTA
ncbi:MAG: sigma-70 family RNA polymerase sigma factor [Spirochaetaceae bacterium]|jgi:RNA polymerase sigma-70 factor (ECF subfamily)|nr:sigma-70 family RNA polymerase sigma factor [Spirochaetaceae bacterium]